MMKFCSFLSSDLAFLKKIKILFFDYKHYNLIYCTIWADKEKHIHKQFGFL